MCAPTPEGYRQYCCPIDSFPEGPADSSNEADANPESFHMFPPHLCLFLCSLCLLTVPLAPPWDPSLSPGNTQLLSSMAQSELGQLFLDVLPNGLDSDSTLVKFLPFVLHSRPPCLSLFLPIFPGYLNHNSVHSFFQQIVMVHLSWAMDSLGAADISVNEANSFKTSSKLNPHSRGFTI